MLRRFIVALLFAVAPFAASAEDCNAPGSTEAKPLAFAVTDADSAQALSNAIVIGMTQELRYHHLNLKAGDPRCEAASVAIGSSRFVLRANDTNVAARTIGDHAEAYLVATLRPAAANRLVSGYLVSRAAGGSSMTRVDPSEVIYMLAGRTDDRHVLSIFGFYDAIPDTPRLAQMLCQAAIGSLPVAAHFETKTGGVTFDDVSAIASFAGRPFTSGPCTVGPAP